MRETSRGVGSRLLRPYAAAVVREPKDEDVSGLLALHYEQVQWFRFRDTQYRENRMSLAAMVCLMIEQMGKNCPTRLPLGDSV